MIGSTHQKHFTTHRILKLQSLCLHRVSDANPIEGMRQNRDLFRPKKFRTD